MNIKSTYPKIKPLSKTTLFVFLVLGTLIYSCQPNQPVPKDLFQQFFSFEIPEEKLPKAGTAARTLEAQAFRLLKEGNYPQSAILFSELAAQQKDSGFMLYRGISLLANQSPEEARKSLQQVRASSAQYPESLWYLALTELASNNPQAAQKHLQKLSGLSLTNIDQNQLDALIVQLQKR